MSEIRDRLEKNFKKRAPLVKKYQLEAYRLYDRDIPEYPFIVDIYGDSVVLADRREEIDFSEEKKHHIENIKKAIREVVNPKEVIEKRRAPQRQGAQKSDQYQKFSRLEKRQVIQEGPAKFWVNLHDYIDTGLFLDHRVVRQKIMKSLKPEMRFLNLFSYTASVSVFAALAGARTMSVDLSKTYTEWAQENFKLNGLLDKAHQFVEEDVFEWMRESENNPRFHKMFDLVFIDPPTFSNSKKMQSSFDVERDHAHLLKVGFQFLKPGGILIFSNNKRYFKLDPKVSAFANVRDISAETLPFDFRDQRIRHVFELKAL